MVSELVLETRQIFRVRKVLEMLQKTVSWNPSHRLSIPRQGCTSNEKHGLWTFS